MSRFVSMTLTAACAVTATVALADSGLSREADYLRDNLRIDRDRTSASHALFGDKAAAIEDLRDLLFQCSNAGWDGYGAVPLSADAVSRAEQLLRALPEGIALPQISPDPDGSLILDWEQSRWRSLSLNIGASERMAYAWLDGAERGHAIAVFDGKALPARLLQTIKDSMPRNATVRTT